MRPLRDINLEEIPITLSTDGLYHGKVTVGKKANGDLDRRHRSGRTEKEVRNKFRVLLRKLDAGTLGKAGRAPTVESWFTYWLTEVAPHGRTALRPSTLRTYWSYCRNWIFPHLGRWRLEELDANHLDALYKAMRTAKPRPGRAATGPGRRPGSLLQVHAILRRGLGVAQVRGKVGRNVAADYDPPATPRAKRSALPTAVAESVIRVAGRRRNAARWWVGLSIGPRQGEALGLCWPQVDLDAGTVEIAWQLQRRVWDHGCKDPHACGATSGPKDRHGKPTSRHRFTPCRPASRGPRKGRCAQHTGAGGCPPPCPRDCARHAAHCPDRIGGGLVLCRPKTWQEDAEPHIVGLAPQVVEALRRHRRAQRAEKKHAGNAWRKFPHPEGGIADFVFRQPDGAPIDPRQDWAEFQAILAEAGVPGERVHALRHTAATELLASGVDLAVVQEVLGHAQINTTRGYATVRTAATAAAARVLGDRLFGQNVTDLVTERERRRAS